ncbi:MAG: TRC40/GET3/ArsA family transport-energizing ATPase [Verrucomicrobiia bacterium]
MLLTELQPPFLPLAPLPPVLLFTGKGGVGKTTLSCAAAVALADAGERVLLVSTDPASNLDEMLGVSLGLDPLAVPGVNGLEACNLDPEEAARRHREEVIGPVRGVLPEALVRQMEEQLSGSCTVDVAAFNGFVRFVADGEVRQRYDRIVLDTAPTGHTLRLLSLPGAWTDFLDSNRSGYSCLGPVEKLVGAREQYRRALVSLRDGRECGVFLVARPDPESLKEAERTREELATLGLRRMGLILNYCFRATHRSDPVAAAWEARGEAARQGMARGLASLPMASLPFRPQGTVGIHTLRSIGQDELPVEPEGSPTAETEEWGMELGRWEEWVAEAVAKGSGVYLFMGKGGVGKTTLAERFAREVAAAGARVHLSTTDPAAHLDLSRAGAGLEISRIDPAAEVSAYCQAVMQMSSDDLDAGGRALLEEELRSPCTEEIAVFRAFAERVGEGKDKVVVLDTAPTGHTVLLLDASLAYAREMERQTAESLPESAVRLLPRLRDPAWTAVFLVTLPEATPLHEAAALADDLRRAGIEPKGWMVNQALLGSGTSDPGLIWKARAERDFCREVARLSHGRWTLVPWMEVCR